MLTSLARTVARVALAVALCTLAWLIVVPIALARSVRPFRGPRHPRHWPRLRDYATKRPEHADGAQMGRLAASDGTSLLLGRTVPRCPLPRWLPGAVHTAYLRATTHELHLSEARRLRHVLAVGGPAAGKTARLVLPGLVREIVHGRGHVIAVDAKPSQMLDMVGHLARDRGMRVISLDALDPHGDAVEPLWGCPPAALRGLVEAVVQVDAKERQDNFFEKKAVAYAVSLCVLVQSLPRRMASLPIVAQVALLPMAARRRLFEAALDLHRDPCLPTRVADAVAVLGGASEELVRDTAGRPPHVTDALDLIDMMGPDVAAACRSLRAGDDTDAVRARIIDAVSARARLLEAHYQPFAEVEESPDNTGGSVRTTVAGNLEPLASGPLARMFSAPDVRITDLASSADRTLVVVAVHTGGDTQMARIAGVLVDWALRSVSKRHYEQAGETARRPCWFLLDELAQLRIPRLDRHLTLIREMGGGVTAAVQSVNQLRDGYGDAATNTLLDTVGTVLYLGGVGETEAMRVSRALGEAEITIPEPGAGPRGRTVHRRARVPRMGVDDLQQQRVNGRRAGALVLQTAGVPFLAEMPLYYDDPALRAWLRLAPTLKRTPRSRVGVLLARTLSRRPGLVPPNAAGVRWARAGGALVRARRSEAPETDPYAATVREIVGAPADAVRPALQEPTLDLAALGVEAVGRSGR